jgi:hypothetical protein
MRWSATIVSVGWVAFAIAAFVSWMAPFAPRVHDEFSYLLAADTLLHGRLANPTPEIWQPFQSFHILLSPAYVSKYPLGHGMFVAVGWLVLGLPIAGCWLAAGVCAASTTWMLAGLTSRRWAVAGGLLVACHPAMQSMWSQSLLSGWLTAAGSTLLTGSVLRLRSRFRGSAALAGGVGVALLALTRPFEGLVATCVSSLLLWMLWQGRELTFKWQSLVRIVPVAAVPVSVALALIALQSYTVSGTLTGLPYRLHEEQYSAAPLFVFGQPRTPMLEATGEVPQTMIHFQQGWALDSYRERPGLWGWLLGLVQAIHTIWGFWVLLAMVPVLSVGWWSRFRVPRFLLAAAAVQIMLSAAVCWVFPHYLSPLLPWLVGLTILGLRRIFRIFVRAQLVGLNCPQRFVGTILAVQVVLLLISANRVHRDPERMWARQRAEIVADLEARGGEHLVLVHYSPQHNVHREWVYNLSDLDRSPVLWARGERDDWNRQLMTRYAHQRHIWRIDADNDQPQPQLLSSPTTVATTHVP